MQNPIFTVTLHAGEFTEPANFDERVAEFRRRCVYVMRNYSFWRLRLGNDASFNRSLAQLKKVLREPVVQALPKLHIELQVAVTHFAREHAMKNGRSGPLSASDFEAGAREAVTVLKPRQGRPASRVLRYHVEGLVALFAEGAGVEPRATRDKNSVYDPQVTNPAGKHIVDLIRGVDPSITEATIARMIVDISAKHGGMVKRFAASFPGYGATVTPF